VVQGQTNLNKDSSNSGWMSIWMRVLGLCLMLLRGEFALAESKAASVMPYAANPASGAFLERNSGSLYLTPLSSNDVKLRYVGSETLVKKADSPFSFSDIQIGVVTKITKHIGLGVGEIIPPVSVQRKISGIPVVILNQVNFVDLDVVANVKYGFSFFGSYLVNNRLSLGIGAAGRQIDIKASGGTEGGKIFDGHFVMTNNSVTIGANYVVIPDRLRIGVASSIFASDSFTALIETPLSSGAGGAAGGAGPKSSAQTSNRFLADFLSGFEFSPNKFATIYSDFLWKRVDQSQREFSVVDLVEKKKDIQNTLSYFGGVKYKVKDEQYGLLSVSYEPSAIGPGSKGENGLSGFGMKETILLYSGFGDLVPAWSLMASIQFGDGLKVLTEEKSVSKQIKAKQDERRASKRKIWDQFTVTAGVRYRRASLGVDLDGELPGAYSQVKLQFPVSVQVSF
jgi:hypothetical protein